METNTLEYRPDLGREIDRLREWFNPEGGIRHLVTIVPGTWNSFNWDLSIGIETARPLEEYDFSDEAQLYEHLDFRLSQLETYWKKKREWDLDDDMVPVFEPRLGWAESAAALVDSEVRYYAQTSGLVPVIKDYDSFDWNSIGLNTESPGAQILKKANEYAVRKAEGKFLVMPWGETLNPSDLARACRGDELFLDFVNDPDGVHALMERCLSASIDLIEYVRGIVRQTAGGYAVSWNGGYWVPGTILGHVGDNVSDPISSEMYEGFIFPYIKRFGRRFGGIIFGRYVTTRQLWPILPKLGIVKAFKPRDMGHVSVAPDDILKIADATEGLPLFVEVHSYEDFAPFKNAVRGAGIKAFFVIHCSTRDQGERAIEEVRDEGARGGVPLLR
ncbi:MAG: hypothetical protein ACUVXI_20075 [bacterium]